MTKLELYALMLSLDTHCDKGDLESIKKIVSKIIEKIDNEEKSPS